MTTLRLTRSQQRQLRDKRRWVTTYAVTSILTLGVMGVIVAVALERPAWSLAWFGCWGFFAHQTVMLVVHLRSLARKHVELGEMTERFTQAEVGRVA